MPALAALRDASSAAGAARALRAAMAGQVITQGHAPRWVTIAALALIAVPAALVLTKRKLTDTQLLVAFAAAEQVLWRSTPLVEAVHRVLSFVWPLLGAPVAGTGPQTSSTESSAPLTSVFLFRARPAGHRRVGGAVCPSRPG
ncbi:hypothetical protein ACFV0B_20750 [Streptomyces xanthophaeus]|uniref:hypothetical protein n=1 Tax=Streptomyces xanthophaeus TaxID=67385 RepID=UPI0036AACB75